MQKDTGRRQGHSGAGSFHGFIRSLSYRDLLSIYSALSTDRSVRKTAVNQTEEDPNPAAFTDSWR